MADHRRKYKEFQQGKFQLIASFELFERYGVENCRIELEEMFPCNNKEELLSREGYYIKNSECLNKRVPGRTYDDYKHDNRALIQSINSKHYYKNKEKILNIQKEHITCGCGSSIRRSDKAKHEKSLKHQEYLNSLNNQEQEKEI